MKKYWVVIATSAVLGSVALPLIPEALFIPTYVLALVAALLAAFGLQMEALQASRALREREERHASSEPATSAKRA